MIAYSLADYIRLLISALVYGGVFSILECLSICSFCLLKNAFWGIFSVFNYQEKPFEYKIKNDGIKPKRIVCEALTAFRTVLFCMGFIILSFYFFDGEIRIFAVFLSLFVYILFLKYLSPFAFGFITAIFTKVIEFSVISIRVATYPVRCIILHFVSCFSKISKHFMQNSGGCRHKAIDKHIK